MKTVWTVNEATDALLVNAACELQRHGHTQAEAHERARYWLDVITARVKAEAWDEARKRVSDAHPSCTDECDMCIARDEILDDLSANPYRAAETEATR